MTDLNTVIIISLLTSVLTNNILCKLQALSPLVRLYFLHMFCIKDEANSHLLVAVRINDALDSLDDLSTETSKRNRQDKQQDIS